MSGGFPPNPLGNCTITRTLGVPGIIISSGICRNGLLNIEPPPPPKEIMEWAVSPLFNRQIIFYSTVSSLIWVHDLKFERPRCATLVVAHVS